MIQSGSAGSIIWLLIFFVAATARGTDLSELGGEPQLGVLCHALSAQSGKRLELEGGSSALQRTASPTQCVDSKGTPWVRQLTDGDTPVLRFSSEALEALAAGEGGGGDTLGHILALDDVESVAIIAGGEARMDTAPTEDPLCAPADEAQRKMESAIAALGLRTPSEENPLRAGEIVCFSSDSPLALLVTSDGRIGRVGLAPEALDHLAAQSLEDPGAFLNALANELPGDLKHWPQQGVRLTFTYRGGKKVTVTVRAHNLDYYVQ